MSFGLSNMFFVESWEYLMDENVYKEMNLSKIRGKTFLLK